MEIQQNTLWLFLGWGTGQPDLEMIWDVKEAVTKKEESSICHMVMLPSQITWQINRIVVGETESTTHRYDPANHDCCWFSYLANG